MIRVNRIIDHPSIVSLTQLFILYPTGANSGIPLAKNLPADRDFSPPPSPSPTPPESK